MTGTIATAADVRRLFGEINDHDVSEIVESGATLNELEEVAAHLADETDVMADLERPLTGRVRQIYQMLRTYDDRLEDDR